jgi:hypothetical protein
VDPVSGNERPGPPITETKRPARFSQAAVANSSQQRELLAAQDTQISEWTILVGARTLLTSKSTVVNEATGEKFAISGRVARRPEKHPKFLAASARLISDMQA